jgi:hypothetical protein
MDSPSKRIGNEEGLGLLAEIDKKFNTQGETIRQLQEETKLIRISELGFFSGELNYAARAKRNEIVHGANLKRDIEALDFLKTEDKLRLKGACEGFKASYGLSESDGRAAVKNAPEQVITAINMRRNLRYLDSWAKKSFSRGMVANCDLIIDTWLQSVRSGKPYPESEMTPIFAKLTDWRDKSVQ